MCVGAPFLPSSAFIRKKSLASTADFPLLQLYPERSPAYRALLVRMASFSSVHWIVAILAGGSATMGTFSVYLDVSNYLASTYHRHASSALAAQSFC